MIKPQYRPEIDTLRAVAVMAVIIYHAKIYLFGNLIFSGGFLGEIPINSEVGKCGDEGKPIVEANPEHEISKIYLDFAKKIKSTYL